MKRVKISLFNLTIEVKQRLYKAVLFRTFHAVSFFHTDLRQVGLQHGICCLLLAVEILVMLLMILYSLTKHGKYYIFEPKTKYQKLE